MKLIKLTLSLILFFNIIPLQAQFIVYEEDEGLTPYTDYQIFETHSLDLNQQETLFDFRIKNTGSSPIFVRIHIDSVINSNGDAELCIDDLCSYPVLQGDFFPLDHPITVQPGQLAPFASTSKFANRAKGIDPNKAVDFVLKFYQEDSLGNQIGTPLHVRCRYTPLGMGISNSINANDITIAPNPVKTSFSLQINSTANISSLLIRDLLGREITTIPYNNTTKSNGIDISDLKNGIYFIQLMNNDKVIGTKKLIKI